MSANRISSWGTFKAQPSNEISDIFLKLSSQVVDVTSCPDPKVIEGHKK